MSKTTPSNIVRLAVEITRGTMKMSDVHETLRKQVQRVLDSGAVSHMTKGQPVERGTRFVGSGFRRARTV